MNGRETWDECEEKVRKFLVEQLRIEIADDREIGIERAHRLPAGNGRGPRRVIVKFLSYKVRSQILQVGRNLRKGSCFMVTEDFSPLVRARRRNLIPFLQKAKEENKRATLVYDTLLIEGEKFRFDDDNQELVKI